MGSSEKGRGKVGTSVAMLMVGLLMGSVMLTPVGAHIKNFNHLKTKHFFTKKAADARFVNVGEAAANATNAANADKLDTLDSTAFQQKCQPGAVLAYAFVDEATLSTTAFATTGVGPTFNCAGSPITVQKRGTGDYVLKIPGVTDAATYTGKLVANVSAVDGGCIFGFCGTSSDTLAVLFPAKLGLSPAAPDQVHVGTFDVAVDTDDGSGNDQSGGEAVNSDFAITVYAFA